MDKNYRGTIFKQSQSMTPQTIVLEREISTFTMKRSGNTTSSKWPNLTSPVMLQSDIMCYLMWYKEKDTTGNAKFLQVFNMSLIKKKQSGQSNLERQQIWNLQNFNVSM